MQIVNVSIGLTGLPSVQDPSHDEFNIIFRVNSQSVRYRIYSVKVKELLSQRKILKRNGRTI